NTRGDTITSSDTVIRIRASSANCIISNVSVGTLISQPANNEATILTSGGYCRFKITDEVEETVIFYADSPLFVNKYMFDMITVDFSPSASVMLTEVAPNAAVPYVELYVTATGNGMFPPELRLWDGEGDVGQSVFAAVSGLVGALSGGDYIVCWAGDGTSDVAAKDEAGSADYWDLYLGTGLNLNKGTEDGVELRSASGVLDAVHWGPTNAEIATADRERVQTAISEGEWRYEGDTINYADLVHLASTGGISHASSPDVANSKYGWYLTDTTPGAGVGSDFQQYAGVGVVNVYPRAVYPGASNVYFAFDWQNTSGVAAKAGSFAALTRSGNFPAFSMTGSAAGHVTNEAAGTSDTADFFLKGSDTAYVRLTSDVMSSDTLRFIYGPKATGTTIPASEGSSQFYFNVDLYGTAIKPVTPNNTVIYHVYPDTCQPGDTTVSNLWGTCDTVAIFLGYDTGSGIFTGVARAPVTVMITSRGTVTGTRLLVDGTLRSNYWTSYTTYTDYNGYATIGVYTDANCTGNNTMMFS
ncbi:MAG TPA: hypothetical protein PKM88_15500, partial [bacterium]|nr:hypothetical protein [bacterium]